MARSPPPNMSSPEKKSVEKASKNKKEIVSDSSDDEELQIPKNAKKQNFEMKDKRKNNNEKPKKVEEKLKKVKKGRKKKSDGETETSSSDENKKKVNSISNSSSSSEDSSSSEEDEKEEKTVRNRKSFEGRKTSTVTSPTVAGRRPKSGNNKRPSKRSGEYEGLDGGEKINILTTTTTTTTSRHQNNQDVAKVCSDINASAKVAANKTSSEQPNQKGILNRAIGRLLEIRQSDDSKFRPKSDEREANDADVEDEVDEKSSIKMTNGKSKVALAFESPTKKLKKRSPDLANRRFKRAAANKASDRIARESRGSINLDSSTSSSSSDLEESTKNKIDKKKAAEKSGSSSSKKLEIFTKKLKAELPTLIRHSDSSDFEDENATLASKFKKGIKRKPTIVDTSVDRKKIESSTTTKRKRAEESGLSDDLDSTKKRPPASKKPNPGNHFTKRILLL